MIRLREKSVAVRRFILEHVDTHPTDIAKLTALHFGLTRQAVNKHLQRLIEEKSLTTSGQTRNRIYKLAFVTEWDRSYQITPTTAEDIVWRQDVRPVLGDMPTNILEIWHYGFTEMLNNVLDHSCGKTLSIHIRKTAPTTEMILEDNGVGIFKKIQTSLNLLDERHALFELSKGKLTTDPTRHSGEGIFFTSRMFDAYNILSGGVHFSHTCEEAEDWVAETHPFAHGTRIWMKLSNHASRTIKKIFDQYTTDKTYGFSKTVVPVRLAQYGDELLVSRSQAKRLVARIELFTTVIFDFTEVKSIGQAFADEIFRVFALQNPRIELLITHANTEVTQMINRAKVKV